MNCLNFPIMFNGNTTTILTDEKHQISTKKEGSTQEMLSTVSNQATTTCLYLLLNVEKREMPWDPDFGVRIKKYVFDQNNYVLKDILIDDIYVAITTFCPQVFIDRKNISIKQQDNKLYASITYKNKIDFQTNTIELVLFEGENEE